MKEYVIRCGTLIDGTGKPPVREARILVRGERIVRVEQGPGTGLEYVPDFVEATNNTVLPGLIDSHRHYFNCGGFGTAVGTTPKQIYLNITKTLKGGVTSALDLAGPFFLPFVAKLPFAKPRMFRSGPIVTCKGGYPAEFMPRLGYMTRSVVECDSEKEIRSLVRALFRKGVDIIKTQVVSTTFRRQPQVVWTDRQLRTLTDEAHSLGLKVAAHITFPQDYGQAIRCGIDSVHHLSSDPMYEEDLDAMVEKGMTCVPTVSLLDLMARGLKERWIDDPSFNPPVNRAIKKTIRDVTDAFHKTTDDQPVKGIFIAFPKAELVRCAQEIMKNLRRFVAKGGIVAMGTDASLGFSFHTSPYRELELMKESGISELEVIKASTLTAATVFNRQHELGSIEQGKLADILIVKGDPLTDISSVKNIDTVIIGGKVLVGKQPAGQE
jgi:imidazolonepropionase-like amidohydrolase